MRTLLPLSSTSLSSSIPSITIITTLTHACILMMLRLLRSRIFCMSLLCGITCLFSHKKNCQDYYNSDCSPHDFDQVYYDIQDTEGSSAWNMQASFSHPNLHSSIICILPRWDPFIHTMSSNVYIISLTHRFCSVFLVTLD